MIVVCQREPCIMQSCVLIDCFHCTAPVEDVPCVPGSPSNDIVSVGVMSCRVDVCAKGVVIDSTVQGKQ